MYTEEQNTSLIDLRWPLTILSNWLESAWKHRTSHPTLSENQPSVQSAPWLFSCSLFPSGLLWDEGKSSLFLSQNTVFSVQDKQVRGLLLELHLSCETQRAARNTGQPVPACAPDSAQHPSKSRGHPSCWHCPCLPSPAAGITLVPAFVSVSPASTRRDAPQSL